LYLKFTDFLNFILKSNDRSERGISFDKSLKGKHNGKFRIRAGNYRIIYLKENNLLVITIIRVAHRKRSILIFVIFENTHFKLFKI